VTVDNAAAERLPKRNRYRVTACIDVSATDLVDQKGASVLPTNAPSRTKSEYELQRDGGKWYVVRESAEATC
jgi:hypothetical protein